MMSILFNFLQFIIGGIPSRMGYFLRSTLYRFFLKEIASEVRIDPGVRFINPKQILLKERAWLMSSSVLIGPIEKDKQLVIGQSVQIGYKGFINGLGGCRLGFGVTLSTSSSIYSVTHLPSTECGDFVSSNSRDSKYPPLLKFHYVEIADGSWLSHGATVICCSIGRDSFLYPHSVLTQSVGDNEKWGGAPAKYISMRYLK